MMLENVRRLIHREAMLEPGQPLWVAVSGGVDSMVLLHVLRELGHPCRVAHVDHGLRAEESDADRAFVAGYARENGIPFSVKEVHPKAAADGESIQMAARRLRYEWFGELLKHGPDVLALGHHRDDVVETLLLNLLRGAGIRGWGGIPPVTRLGAGILCRPLLDLRRENLLAYAREKGIPFREDGSNTDPKYLRNRVRHELVPLLEDLRPGATGVLARETRLLSEVASAARSWVERAAAGFPAEQDGTRRIPLDALLASRTPVLLLMQLIGEPGPHPKELAKILEAAEREATGAEFHFHGRRISVANGALWLDRPSDGFPTINISLAHGKRGSSGRFHWQPCKPEAVDLGQGMHTAWLDTATLANELVLRPWRRGDRMRPVGLDGSKLISDILIDAHVPAARKEGTYVLCSGDTIVWLVGHRIAEGHQPTAKSKEVLQVVHATNDQDRQYQGKDIRDMAGEG